MAKLKVLIRNAYNRHELHEFEQGSNRFHFLGDKPTTSPIDTRLFREISLVTEHSNIANVHFEIIRCDLKVFRKDLKKKRGMAKINYSDFHPHKKLVIMQAFLF